MNEEIVRPAELASLPALLAHAVEACARAGLEGEASYAVRLAVEEVALNLINYGNAGSAPGPIAVRVDVGGERVVVTIADRARPFPPDAAPAPDLHAAWEDRPPGGLGWHLIRQLFEEIRYESGPDGNVLTLAKSRRQRPHELKE